MLGGPFFAHFAGSVNFADEADYQAHSSSVAPASIEPHRCGWLA
jgi:hypothetical protein